MTTTETNRKAIRKTDNVTIEAEANKNEATVETMTDAQVAGMLRSLWQSVQTLRGNGKSGRPKLRSIPESFLTPAAIRNGDCWRELMDQFQNNANEYMRQLQAWADRMHGIATALANLGEQYPAANIVLIDAGTGQRLGNFNGTRLVSALLREDSMILNATIG